MSAGICVVETFMVAIVYWASRTVSKVFRLAPGEMIVSFDFAETSLLSDRSTCGACRAGMLRCVPNFDSITASPETRM